MSVRLFPDDLRFEQRLLKSAGFYSGKIDGKYGPQTAAAEDAADAGYADIQKTYGAYDARSEKAIRTLLPAMQIRARQILKLALQREAETGIHCTLLSGTRTYAEQDELYRKIPKVTNARGGQSNHNFGIAVDVGLFRNGKYLTGAGRGDDAAYASLATAVKKEIAGIDWGGDWKSFKDLPHFEYHTGKSLAQVRNAFEAGALALAKFPN